LDNDSGGKKATAQCKAVLQQSQILDYQGKDPGENPFKISQLLQKTLDNPFSSLNI